MTQEPERDAKPLQPVKIKLDQDNYLVTSDGQPLYVYKLEAEKYDDQWSEKEQPFIKQWMPLPSPARAEDDLELGLGSRIRPSDLTKRSYAQVTLGAGQLPLYTYVGTDENPFLDLWQRVHLEDVSMSSDNSDDRGQGRNGP